MLCQNCGKSQATAHIHSVINGVVKDRYLCSECAAAEKADDFYENGIFKMLSSFLNEGKLPEAESTRCECCGATLDMIRRSGRVGCGNCYKTFEKELASALRRIHGRTVHVGKRPGALTAESAQPEQKSGLSQAEKLKAELKEAIAREEYEKAAELRDEIRRLEE